MNKIYQFAMLAVFCLSLVSTQNAEAKSAHNKLKHRNDACCCKEFTCNEAKDHPERFVGTYLRTDALTEGFAMPLYTLNADGTVVGTQGEALIRFVTEGTFGPLFGNWKYIGNEQVLVMAIGWSAIDTPETQQFSGARLTFIVDFSKSLNYPMIVARSTVSIDPPFPSALLLDPNAGTVIFNDPITPRQLQRVCAFSSDLTR